MKKQFKLSHLALYAKGWYKKTDDIWADLLKILELDNYTPFTKNDVFIIILGCFDRAEFDSNCNELRKVLEGIHPSNCWKVGYYTKGTSWFKGTQEEKDSLPEYDMPTAFIYYVISSLRFIESNNWILVTPKYTKYPKARHITTKAVIDAFNKKQII